jgi:Cytochrome C'
MSRKKVWRTALLLALAFGMTWSAVAQERIKAPAAANQPRLVPVAETKLVMEGIAHANYQGIQRQLQQKPEDGDTWTILRGQALLVAESGNLLMIRPPKNDGQGVWMQRAADLRDAGAMLAKQAGNRDYERSKAAFDDMTNTCNRCHQTFRVPVQIGAPPPPPPPEKNDRKTTNRDA